MTILCVATYLKGEAFIRECHRLGCTVLLLTAETLADAAWPRDAIHEIHTVPRTASDADVRYAVAGIARRHRIARLAALDDFDVETGAMLREFLQIPGFGRTVAARFRDKLTMRTDANRLGLTVPAFTGVFNDDEVNEWASRVPPPWVLKPRSSAAAIGIRQIATRDDPEIVTRIRKPHHAGLIVRSPDALRIQTLLDDYARRFARDFLATMPPPERPVE